MSTPGTPFSQTSRRHAETALALTLASLLLFLVSATLPFVSASKLGSSNDGMLFSGISSLWIQGNLFLAALVFLIGVALPLARGVCLAILSSAALGVQWTSTALQRARRLHVLLGQWSMADIQVLAILIAFVKLSALVTATPRAGLICYAAAALLGLFASTYLNKVPSQEDGNFAGIRRHKPDRRGWAAAFALSALAFLVPAYALPVMKFSTVDRESADTILSGVLKLWNEGMYGIAGIVFVASLLVPLLKLLAIALLLLSQRWNYFGSLEARRKLHVIVHAVGRWSMLDVFLVAFLCGIVRFQGLASVEALSGIVAFAVAVIFTMISTSHIHAD